MKKYDITIILLHGFSMDKEDMEYYSEKFNKYLSNKYSMRFITPNSKKLNITIYNNRKYNAWYDYLTGHCEKEPLINEKQLLESRVKLHKIINKAVEYHNNDYSKIFISGMSQGCCMALDSGFSFNKKIGGIIGFKGHVINKTLKDFKTQQNIWVCHGKKDKTIFFDFAKETYKNLEKLNNDLFFLAQNTNHGVKTGIHEQMKSIYHWI